MQIGFIGLGKMGSRIVEKLLADGHEVVAWNRSPEAISNLKTKIENRKSKTSSFAKASADKQNLKVGKSIEGLVLSLEKPRIVWLMLPPGDVTENSLQEVIKFVDEGDIVIDGGNAFYKDSERRSKALSAEGIAYLGIGVSGGIKAAETGYPMMIGGDKDAFEVI
jgi:6-phosphogluconate dehydrogenase